MHHMEEFGMAYAEIVFAREQNAFMERWGRLPVDISITETSNGSIQSLCRKMVNYLDGFRLTTQEIVMFAAGEDFDKFFSRDREPLEFYIVSGEMEGVLDPFFLGDPLIEVEGLGLIWGRTTSGQALYMDGGIQECLIQHLINTTETGKGLPNLVSYNPSDIVYFTFDDFIALYEEEKDESDPELSINDLYNAYRQAEKGFDCDAGFMRDILYDYMQSL